MTLHTIENAAVKVEFHFTFWKNQGLGFAWYPLINQGGILFFLWAFLVRVEYKDGIHDRRLNANSI